MELEVIGLDHIYITVSDLPRSEAFYDGMMKILGFRKAVRPISGAPHIHYFNRCLRYTIRPAAPRTPVHDQNAPGLHHLCFQVPDRESVDTAARLLNELGIDASPPQLYPEYTSDYYATFFRDPDGIELEIVNLLQVRKDVVTNWQSYVPIGD